MHHADWVDLVTFLKYQNMRFSQTVDQLKDIVTNRDSECSYYRQSITGEN